MEGDPIGELLDHLESLINRTMKKAIKEYKVYVDRYGLGWVLYLLLPFWIIGYLAVKSTFKTEQ